MPRKKKGRVLNAILLVVTAACVAVAVVIFAMYAGQDSAYEALSEQVAPQGGQGGGIDWDALLQQNPETVAWLSVEGTGIDYPVVQPGEGKPSDWYLHHDFWGNPSSIGSLYLDSRADADGRHMLVFGHHLGLSGQMFSPIYDTYKQGEFDGIGTAHWSTPGSGTVDFEPVMAMSVDKSYEPIQTFEFATVDELQSWLGELSHDATAVSPELDSLTDGASRVLTLVTCSSAWSGQRARTLLVFVA